MTSFRYHVVGSVAFVVAALTIVLGSREAFAQNPNAGTAPVTIVNPLPLPVTVANSPTKTTIDNPATNPVLIRDVDVAQREPVQFRGVGTVFTGTSGSTEFVTVPAGKILVIEHVSASINLATADNLLSCSLLIFEVAGDVDHQVCHPMGHNALNNVYAANASTKFYAGPGKSVRFLVSTFVGNSAGTTGSVSAFASGYYIPAP